MGLGWGGCHRYSKSTFRANNWRKYFFGGRRRTEKEKDENIWRRKLYFLPRGRKKRKIFGEEGIYFAEEKKSEEGKGGE